MKKNLIILFVALSVFMPSQAQFRFGLRGGVNSVDNDITAVSLETVTSTDSYTGYFVGPSIELDLLGLGINVAALYSQKGMKLANEETFKKNNLDIPVSVKLFFGDSGIQPFLQGGLQFSFLMGDVEKKYIDVMTGNDKLYQVSSFSFDNSNWSMNIGAGLKLFDHLNLTVNYNMPVTKEGVYSFYDELEETQAMNVLEKANAYDSIKERGNSKFKSSTMQFSVEFIF